MISVSGSQIGLAGVVGLSILYKNSDSRTVATGIALAVVGAVFAASLWVAGTVQTAVAESKTYLQGYSDNTKKFSSIALGMIAGAGTFAVAYWTVSTALDRSFSSYN
ncbi:MAG TPA: hypothetical protein VIJ14_09940 [Rhabdochlamydiaceae bacterium]